MTIFDFISSILFTKKKITASAIDVENEFVPFLVNRWLSMYSASCAKISNTINRYMSTLNKAEIYNLCIASFEKQPNKKINYFKRTKDEDKKVNEDIIKKIAIVKELSVREVREYFKLLNYKAE